MSGKRGEGSIYRRGNIFWIKYYYEGAYYRESTGSEKEMVARKFLQRRLGEIALGRFIGPDMEQIALKSLCEDVITDYMVNAKRSLDRAQRSMRHVLDFFGDAKAKDITTDKVNKFVCQRQAYGLSNAEINRELALLKRAFNLGIQAEKILRKPYIPMLKENNVRKGFFEQEEFDRLHEVLPEYLRPFVMFAYITGWRRSEIADLKWHQVDLRLGTIRIDPGQTKGGEGRLVFLVGELRVVIDGQIERRRLDCPYVFHRDGYQIRDFRHAWESAIQKSHNEGKIFHDLRRTAVRNMVRAGVPERIAMSISGHKTRSVFDRYNIVSETDLREAFGKIDRYGQNENGHSLGTISNFGKKKG